jgi:IS30 family transposase
MKTKTSTKTHLTFSDRNRLQGGLANKKSFKEIGLELHKSPSTISREIKAHMFINKKGRKYSRYFNDCVYRNGCKMCYVCDDLNCDKDRWYWTIMI